MTFLKTKTHVKSFYFHFGEPVSNSFCFITLGTPRYASLSNLGAITIKKKIMLYSMCVFDHSRLNFNDLNKKKE